MKRGLAITLKVGGVIAAMKAAAALGGAAMVGLALLAGAVVGALCWVVADGERAERLALLIHAYHGAPQQQPASTDLPHSQ